MPKLAVNGLRYHYWQAGPQGAPEVVMIHGLGGNLAVWYAGIVQALWADYHITTVDLAAHGHSDVPEGEYPLEQMLADMEYFLDQLGIKQAHMLGHCLGGDLILNFAMLRPERVGQIVIIETVLADLSHLYSSPDWEGWAYYRAELERFTGQPIPEDKYEDIEYILQQIQAAPLAHGPAKGRLRNPRQIDRMLQGIEMLRQAAAEYKEQEANGTLPPPPTEEEIGRFLGMVRVENLHLIPHKVLLIYEEDSFFISSHDMLKEKLPYAESAFVPPAAIKHLSVLDRSKTMSAYIQAFLQEGTVANISAEDIARAEALVI